MIEISNIFNEKWIQLPTSKIYLSNCSANKSQESNCHGEKLTQISFSFWISISFEQIFFESKYKVKSELYLRGTTVCAYRKIWVRIFLHHYLFIASRFHFHFLFFLSIRIWNSVLTSMLHFDGTRRGSLVLGFNYSTWIFENINICKKKVLEIERQKYGNIDEIFQFVLNFYNMCIMLDWKQL